MLTSMNMQNVYLTMNDVFVSSQYRNDFVMEYIGEVLNYSEFKQRTKLYNKHKQTHFFFMALKSDEVCP